MHRKRNSEQVPPATSNKSMTAFRRSRNISPSPTRSESSLSSFEAPEPTPLSSTDSIDAKSRARPHSRSLRTAAFKFIPSRPAPSPPTEKSSSSSSSPSPLLSKSAFPHFDYLSSARPASVSAQPSATRTTLVKRSNTIATRTPNMSNYPEVDLSSPQVLSSPKLQVTPNGPAERRSVQFSEKKNVNWARPLRSASAAIPEEYTGASNVRLLGTSMQRSRRLKQSPSLDTPSPCSSASESPMTPTTPESAPHTRAWSLPSVSEAKGLGFGPELAWKEQGSESGSALADYLEHSTPSTPSRGSPTPRHSRIISTSDCLVELSSPTTLDELRYLRQAAMDLELEAKAMRAGSHAMVASSSAESNTIRARRIKRKAVPTIDPLDLDLSIRPFRTINFNPSPPPPTAASTVFSKPMRVIPTAVPISSIAGPSLSQSPKTPRTPIKATFPRPPHTPIYSNAKLSRSVVEFSPRSSSLPFFLGGSAPTTHKRVFSAQSARGSESSASISDDEPITPLPTGMTEHDAFVSQMEESLRAFNVGMNYSTVELGSGEDAKKKRGLARFFRKEV